VRAADAVTVTEDVTYETPLSGVLHALLTETILVTDAVQKTATAVVYLVIALLQVGASHPILKGTLTAQPVAGGASTITGGFGGTITMEG
jgi:chemotaxis receptor (MCP) glutamine deamidase CheD